MDLGRKNRPYFQELLDKTRQLGLDSVRPAAEAVDRDARFPHEALAALRKERLLAAAIPDEFGGLGCSVGEVAQLCAALGEHCAASAMVFAMHAIQIDSFVRFGSSTPYFRRLLVEAAERQLLIASVTSEVGIGGDMRTSLCFVERTGERFGLEKKATTISYGEHADGLLLSARRGPDAAPNDQVFVWLAKGNYTLTRTSNWNTLGMRGTCSPGFVVKAEGGVEQILPGTLADIAAQTQVPYSHIVWSSCWLGIATDAIARAHAFVRADARKRPGTEPFGAKRLAQATGLLHSMRANIQDALTMYQDALARPDSADVLSNMGCAIRWNNLKLSASQTVVEIVRETMAICGMAGYSNESKFSMGRQLRDAYSAQLMIANDRLYTTNANLLLVYKDD